MDLQQYASLFVAEAREHLIEINTRLAVLSADVTHSAAPDAVASIFRSVHTIKGMASAMEYRRVAEVAHELETELDAVRTEPGLLTPMLVAQLSTRVDALSHEVDVAVGNFDAGQPSHTEHRHTNDDAVSSHDDMREKVQLSERRLRIDARRLDILMDLTGELEIARGQLEQAVLAFTGDHELKKEIARISRLIRGLRDQVVSARMVPVGQVFERFPHVVRETARALGKEIELHTEGATIELDRSMLEALSDPLLHLLRNAVDHGIESPAVRLAAKKPRQGRVTLSAERESNFVLIRVTDDGAGIDREKVLGLARERGVISDENVELTDSELLHILSRPGFSTANRVTKVSGRGVGMDVVDSKVRALGGAVSVTSTPGGGTTILLRLPLTVAIIRALLGRIETEIFAIPFTNVIETVEIDRGTVQLVAGTPATRIREEWVPLVQLREAVGFPSQESRFLRAVTVNVRGRHTAVVVDEFVGQQDIVVKQFDAPRGVPRLFSGATILSDGAPALIVDMNALVHSAFTPGGNI